VFHNNQGDRWSFVAVLPRSGFIHAIHHGKRVYEEALKFLKKVKKRSDGKAALYLSDAWFYRDALYAIHCHYEPQIYKGRGPYPRDKQIVDPDLKYVQIEKELSGKGGIKSIKVKIIKGNEKEILDIIRKGGRSKTINTSFVESRNGKYRKDNARLIRKTLCHSKKHNYHDAHADLLTANFNYCRENDALKEVINPDAKPFETKFKRKSPAMAEGLTTKILNLKELLCFRTPN
jgi:IS1 family transposase